MAGQLIKTVVGFIVILILLIIFFGSWGTISPGTRGVVVNLGKVTGEIKPEGFYTKMPLLVTVVPMNVQVQKEQVNTQAASKDLQIVSTTIALNLSLSPDRCADVYQTIGVDYLERIVAPAMQESTKAVIAQYTAEELISKRENVRQGIAELLASKLSPIGVRTEAVNIVNFDFSRSFNEAIEAKVTAEQNALAAKNKLEQIKYEAEQRVTTAEGEARAISIQSKAIQENGGSAYIQLKALEKWDGRLPIYNTAGAPVPFIPVPVSK
ncbi:prohibitin family protein [soil metagenome]